MHWQLWLGFVAASALIGLTPGPAVMAIVGYALNGGRRTALASVAGTAIGNATAMSLSLAGAGVVLAASAWAFSALKWAGATYLVVLGVMALWKSRRLGPGMAAGTRMVSPRTAFFSNVAVGVFHPKTIVFFVAFVPQFIDPHGSYAGQAALLVATFVAVVAATDTAYALLAARAAHLLRRPRTATWMQRVGGGTLIAAGAATALAD